MSNLEAFIVNDSDRLLDIVRKLMKDGFFNCHLSSQQFNLLRFIIDHCVQGESRSSMWLEFMNGNLAVQFDESSEEEETKEQKPSRKNSEPTIEAKESEDVNIENQLYLKAGLSYSRNLASKVRYLLWENVIDHLYKVGGATNQEYDVLEMEDEKPVEERPSLPAKSEARDEDENYDEDDDEEEEGEKVEKKKEEETLLPLQDQFSYNDNHQAVIHVPSSYITTKPDLPTPRRSQFEEVNPIMGTASVIESNQMRQNELRLIQNCNKVYHIFEGDQQNQVKRRKLEMSNKKLESLNSAEPAMDDTSQAINNRLLSLGGAANLSLKNLLSKIENERDKVEMSDSELRNLILDVRKNRSKWANDEKIGQEELYEACEKVVLELRGYTEHSTPFLNKVSKKEAPNYFEVIKKPMDLNTILKKLKSFQYSCKSEFVEDLMLIWKNCLAYNSDPRHFLRTHALAMQKKTHSLIPLIPDIRVRDRTEVEDEEFGPNEDVPDTQSQEGTPVAPTTRMTGGKGGKKGRKRTRGAEEAFESDGAETPFEDSNSTAKLEDDKLQIEEADQEQDSENSDHDSTHQLNEDSSDDEDEDVDLQTWNSLTSGARYRLCERRSELFQNSKIRPDAPALLGSSKEMRDLAVHLGESRPGPLRESQSYLDGNDEPFLIEYHGSGCVPMLRYGGLTEDQSEAVERELVDKFFKSGKYLDSLPKSSLVSVHGQNDHFNMNIGLMQDIRRICFKISLIRQMQTQSFVHQSQMKPPKKEDIQDTDIDPASKLDTHNQDDPGAVYVALKRSVSKVLMTNGFETTNNLTVDTMSQICEGYLGNLAKSLKTHIESGSINKLERCYEAGRQKKGTSNRQILLISLLENGVEKPDDLFTYVKERVHKQTRKLKDLKDKLASFLKELLRPGLQDVTETTFRDDSDQFMTGDFSNDIGEDFFGFKELGLDKEFGLLTSTIPLHLLQSRLQNPHLAQGPEHHEDKYKDFTRLHLPKLTKETYLNQIKLLQPFFATVAEKADANYLKVRKKLNEPEVLPENGAEIEFVEDEELPLKQRNSRPRVPPTGKIPGIKKKPVSMGFFLDDLDQSL